MKEGTESIEDNFCRKGEMRERESDGVIYLNNN